MRTRTAELTKGRPDMIAPQTAPDVGVQTWRDWPYGPNICVESRVAMTDWARRHRVKLAKTPRCGHWIAGRRCWTGRGCEHNPGVEPDWLDHVTGWRIAQQPAVLVAQPYPTGGPYDEAVAAFAADHGLRWLVDPRGSWYHHGTTFVALWRPERIDRVMT